MLKDANQEMKRKLTKWEKTFANDIPDKGLQNIQRAYNSTTKSQSN